MSTEFFCVDLRDIGVNINERNVISNHTGSRIPTNPPPTPQKKKKTIQIVTVVRYYFLEKTSFKNQRN